jgi:hypothetical protein
MTKLAPNQLVRIRGGIALWLDVAGAVGGPAAAACIGWCIHRAINNTHKPGSAP